MDPFIPCFPLSCGCTYTCHFLKETCSIKALELRGIAKMSEGRNLKGPQQ